MNKGIFYIVGTPIGNLCDISYRALETLKMVDFIAAEDTRVTLKLLNYFNINTKLISYHKYSGEEKSNYIINKILNGANCALVSDAGMPCISDPGEELVLMAMNNDINVKVIPGPSAVISALSISGMKASRFAFEGFLSTNKKNRLEHLKELIYNQHTLIFYEAPHKLKSTLKDMITVLGDRKISIVKELTKIHENVNFTTLSKAIEEYECMDKVKGEYVLIVEGSKKKDLSNEISNEQVISMVNKLIIEDNMSMLDAIKIVSKDSGYKKNLLYKLILDNKK